LTVLLLARRMIFVLSRPLNPTAQETEMKRTLLVAAAFALSAASARADAAYLGSFESH
jgi:hypothetical protein